MNLTYECRARQVIEIGCINLLVIFLLINESFNCSYGIRVERSLFRFFLL